MTDEYAALSDIELSRRARALHASCEWPDIELPAFLLAGLLKRNAERRAEADVMEAEVKRREAVRRDE